MRDMLIWIIMCGIVILIILVALAFFALMIYVRIKYWNTPVSELPAWVYYLI